MYAMYTVIINYINNAADNRVFFHIFALSLELLQFK